MRENLIRFQDKICPWFLGLISDMGGGGVAGRGAEHVSFLPSTPVISGPVFVNVVGSPGIDSACECSLAGQYDDPICRTGLPALQRLAESIPWNLFLGSLNVYKFGLWKQEKTRWPCSSNTDSYPRPRSLI
jgi:hypothetical protein